MQEVLSGLGVIGETDSMANAHRRRCVDSEGN